MFRAYHLWLFCLFLLGTSTAILYDSSAAIQTEGVGDFVEETPKPGPKKMNITEDAYLKIQPGMTRKDVEAILGGPPGKYTTMPAMILFGDLAIAGGGVRVDRWLGDFGLIHVSFDENDIVVEASFHHVA